MDEAIKEHAEAFTDAVESLAVFASLEGQVNDGDKLDQQAFTDFVIALPAETLKLFALIKALMDEISRRRPTTDIDTLTDLIVSGTVMIGEKQERARTRQRAYDLAVVVLLMVEEGYMRETTKPGGPTTFEFTGVPIPTVAERAERFSVLH
jgi:hypothetical protein